MQKPLLFFAFFTACFSALAQDLRFYQIDEFNEYQQILTKALEEEKIIFSVVYEDNGQFERMVRDNVFENDSMASVYQDNTIPIAIDIASNMGARMAETFGIGELPVFYYFTDEELLVLVESGYQSQQDLLSALKDAQSKSQQYNQLKAKYAGEQLTTDEWIELLDIYALNFSYVETMNRALEFFASLDQNELFSKKVQPLLMQYGLDLETHYPELIVKNREQIEDSTAFADFYASAYSYNFDRAVANEDSVLLEEIVKTLIPVAPGKDTARDKMIFETRKVFAADARVFHVWRDAALERSKSEENDSLRANFLFEEAFEIADNFNTDEAKQAAMQLAHQANELNEGFRYKMLESYMAYLLKDYTIAEKLVDEAAALSDNSQNQKKAIQLKDMILNEKPKDSDDENTD